MNSKLKEAAARKHSETAYAKAPMQTEGAATYTQGVSYYSFLAGVDWMEQNMSKESQNVDTSTEKLADASWFVIGSTNQYSEVKKAIANVCRDVTRAGCIDEICIHDIVYMFRKFGYEVVPLAPKNDMEETR